MTVLGCISNNHDIGLVIVATLVCLAGAWATMRLFRRATATTSSEKFSWIVLTAVVSGAAIWCTHFIAMLGFRPGVPVGFDPVMTIGSLLAAMAGALMGFALAASSSHKLAPEIGGAVVGLAIVVMHYTGMMAFRAQGIVSWDMSYLVASIVLSVALSSAALHFAARNAKPSGSYLGTGIFVLAIITLHFTGMTAFRVEPLMLDGPFSSPEALRALALAVAGVAIPVVGVGIASHLIDNRARTEASEALSNMSNGLVMIAKDETIRLFNERVLLMLGMTANNLHIGMRFSAFVKSVAAHHGWDEAETARVIADIRSSMEQKESTRIEQHFTDGTILSIFSQPMDDGGVILTYDDVTETRHGQKQIAHMAFHDALTGLPNRRSFTAQITALAHSESFAMLMIDLDRFKAVNDTLGHAVGDELLVEATKRLRGECRPSDVLFRLGGDELALLGNLTQDQAEGVANRMVAAFAQPFQIGEHAVTVGLSVGLAVGHRGDDPEDIQRMADLALYKAKEGGRGRAEVYRIGMIEEAARRRLLENELAIAVQHNQFELCYQPLYGLPGRRLVGFEALIRWHHPERGLVSPDEFIPVAEQYGAIIEIGAWVIDQACQQAALWPNDIYVSINVSPVQLRLADTLKQFTLALAKYRLSPRRVEIEITETAMIQNSDHIAATLAGLRALGVRIAMDDFGTGYSSLAHLRSFELDRIKIDRSFISASHTDPNAAAVIRAITTMAKEMSIATTGEGVENEDQLANLVQSGCSTAQGYLLGRPMSARDAAALTGVTAEPRPLAVAAAI